MRLLRSHGMTTLTWDRHRGHAHTYDVVAQGFNYRLDELRAAIGLVQLGRLESANAARAEIAGRYRELLDGVDGLVVPFGEEAQASSSHHLAVVDASRGLSRSGVQGGDAPAEDPDERPLPADPPLLGVRGRCRFAARAPSD